jgi:hypothetical protein
MAAFDVRIKWRDDAGQTGTSTAQPLQNDSGLFYFFDSSNVDALVKVLNGCSINNRYWVFAGGTTDVEYTLTVTDTRNGTQKQYFNPAGRPFAPVTDTSAFATCP